MGQPIEMPISSHNPRRACAELPGGRAALKSVRAIPNPRSEDRRPKPESRPKSEFREWSAWGATRRRAAPGQRGGQSGADHYRGTAAAGLAGGGLARPAQYGPFTAIPAGPAERSQERAKILARGVFLDIGLPTGRRKVRPIHCRTRRQQILTNSTIFLSFV